MALAHITAAVHIPYRLFQAFRDGLIQIATFDFQFQHNAMYGAAVTQESAFSRKNCRKSDSNIDAIVRIHVPCRLLDQSALSGPRQFAEDDFPVNGVGNTQGLLALTTFRFTSSTLFREACPTSTLA